jgi:hypothetical protein
MRICRAISCSIAAFTKRNELMFFSSTRVPNAAAPARRTLTLASQRRWPFSRSPSHTPSARTSRCSAFMYANAWSAERSTGSVTTSHSGTPARLRSTREIGPSWLSLPASSSRWIRASATAWRAPAIHTSIAPCSHSGSSCCEI